MANVLSEEKRQQVIALGRLRWPLRRIEKATGVRRETASEYLKAAGIAVRAPGRWGRTEPNPANEVTPKAVLSSKVTDEGSNPANEVTLDVLAILEGDVLALPERSLCAPYRGVIEAALSMGRNAKGIYQQLVDQHGFQGGYQSVKRYVRTVRPEPSREAHPVIETAAGEEAQVDYGEGPMVLDATTGRYRRTRLFALVLGCSRKAVRLLTWKSSVEIWARLHEKAFRQLGGAPRTVVLDNLREGVVGPDVWDPTVNPLFRDVLKHYGVVALPCRVRHPDRKGKVEAGIGHAQKTPLKGMRFETLEEAQSYLDAWEERWADTRIHGTTKRRVSEMFAAEKPHLLALPAEPFRYYRFGDRTVHLDGHVEVEGGYYSVPPGHLGHLVHVQWDEMQVRILSADSRQLLREHLRTLPGHRRTKDVDRPSRTPPTTLELLARARRASSSIGALTAEMHRREGENSVRRIQGVLALARKHGVALVEEASALAIEVGSPNYRFVRRYLEKHPVRKLKQVDELIRPLKHYQQLINQLTDERTTT